MSAGPNKGESIVKFQSLRKSLTGGLVALATVVLLGSCGGGGAALDPLQGGTMSFLPQQPSGGTAYAGIPFTMAIAGGRRPYALFSSEPGLLAVPNQLEGSTFTIVPNNPGVVDAGLAPEDLPRRTVRLTARDSVGLQAFVDIAVGQNFLTSYGVGYISNCPVAGTSAPALCAGGETVIGLTSVFNGSLMGNRVFRFEVLRGPVSFVFPGTNNTGNSVTTNTDHTGFASAVMRVQANVPTQVVVFRVTDVATGVYADHVAVITQATPTGTTLTAIPDSITFTGALTTECGTGVAEFLVFDGAAPFTAVTSSPDVQVRRISGSSEVPARFEVRANNPGVCLDEVPVIVTDANGSRTTVAVSTERGTTTPTPPPDLVVAPTSITLGCGTSGSVTVIGGTGSYRSNSSNPRVTAVISGNTVTISRLTGDGAATFPTTGAISITDGTDIVTVTATVPANCP
jgi:hypothetical protein